MKVFDFTVGRNKRVVKAYLHDDLSSVCDSVESHPVMIVCPGGAYMHLSPREAEPVGFKFFARGYNVFILYYSIGESIKTESPVRELAECVDIIKKNSSEWMVDRDNISVVGFSAGGHLVASLATLWNKEICDGFDCKVKNVVLAYPVISAGEYAHRESIKNICQDGHDEDYYSLEKRVDKDTIPCFIFHSANDPAVPVENSLLYMMALKRNGIDFEAHIFPYGGHGWSTATREVGTEFIENQSWIDMVLRYLGYRE